MSQGKKLHLDRQSAFPLFHRFIHIHPEHKELTAARARAGYCIFFSDRLRASCVGEADAGTCHIYQKIAVNLTSVRFYFMLSFQCSTDLSSLALLHLMGQLVVVSLRYPLHQISNRNQTSLLLNYSDITFILKK